MKKFAFTLEKILRLRSWSEKEARVELGRAVSALETAEELLAFNAAERQRTLLPAEEGRVSFDMLLVRANYLARLDHEKEALLQQCAAAEGAVEQARARWQAAAAEKKAMENLKDRRRRDYRKTLLREEEKETDDTATKPRM